MPKEVGNNSSKSWLRWAVHVWLIQQTLSYSPLRSLVVKNLGEAVLRPAHAAPGGNCPSPLPTFSYSTVIMSGKLLICSLYTNLEGGWVAEWLACWTQAQKGPGSNRNRDAVG